MSDKDTLLQALDKVGINYAKRPDGLEIIIGRQYKDGSFGTVAIEFDANGKVVK